MYDLGMKIKSLRIERKITQKKLGEIINVSEATISKYESNGSTPSIEILRQIACFFNVSMDTLLEMEKQGTISTQGLSESQSNTVRALINAYHIKNAQTVKQITKEQFSVLGEITAELTK